MRLCFFLYLFRLAMSQICRIRSGGLAVAALLCNSFCRMHPGQVLNKFYIPSVCAKRPFATELLSWMLVLKVAVNFRALCLPPSWLLCLRLCQHRKYFAQSGGIALLACLYLLSSFPPGATSWLSGPRYAAYARTIWPRRSGLNFYLLEGGGTFFMFKKFCEGATGEVFRGGFWMGAFQGPTPKRHMIFANDSTVIMTLEAKGGYLPQSRRIELQGGPLVTKHVDKNCVIRTTGIKRKLKDSQCFATHYWTVCVFLNF